VPTSDEYTTTGIPLRSCAMSIGQALPPSAEYGSTRSSCAKRSGRSASVPMTRPSAAWKRPLLSRTKYSELLNDAGCPSESAIRTEPSGAPEYFA
jgi:hypothetical protein